MRVQNLSALASLRLYVMDCGTIGPVNPQLFDLKQEEVSGSAGIFSPCNLIAHPRGTFREKNLPNDLF